MIKVSIATPNISNTFRFRNLAADIVQKQNCPASNLLCTPGWCRNTKVVISKERNTALLSSVPHKEIWDESIFAFNEKIFAG